MNKNWLSNKVEVYFEDSELEKTVRRSFNNAIENPEDTQVVSFAQAVASLTELPISHAVVVESHKYTFI